MTLYWDREGRVACGDHAPLKNPEAWRLQNWKPITPSTAAGAGMKCRVCGARAEAVQKKHKAVNKFYAGIHKDFARARGFSKTDPIDAPLFAERKPI